MFSIPKGAKISIPILLLGYSLISIKLLSNSPVLNLFLKYFLVLK
ncbi:hypothetical protein C3B56_00340 [Candidatus Annandia adelgestsuga]|uniref:Uncharacterized protein n=1 Tax=Candidatus Annandia adelgestsuga TaxID=1302411 RepID=A0A3S9J7R2_9ENTR|nr:hypothetical protein C3B56_00340 [Candidatus Annandia adelgestsuga]